MNIVNCTAIRSFVCLFVCFFLFHFQRHISSSYLCHFLHICARNRNDGCKIPIRVALFFLSSTLFVCCLSLLFWLNSYSPLLLLLHLLLFFLFHLNVVHAMYVRKIKICKFSAQFYHTFVYCQRYNIREQKSTKIPRRKNERCEYSSTCFMYVYKQSIRNWWFYHVVETIFYQSVLV